MEPERPRGQCLLDEFASRGDVRIGNDDAGPAIERALQRAVQEGGVGLLQLLPGTRVQQAFADAGGQQSSAVARHQQPAMAPCVEQHLRLQGELQVHQPAAPVLQVEAPAWRA